MKNLIVATCLMFAILFGLTLYMHYDTQTFIDSLQQPPTKQHEVSPGEKTHKLEMGTPDTEAEQTDKGTAPVPDTPGDFHEQTDSHGHSHHDDSLVESTPFLESEVTQHAEETAHTEAPAFGTATTHSVQLPPGVVHWKKVNSEGILVVDRDAILAEFGDTPKVHEYLAAADKIHSSDTYTNRELYDLLVLDREFTQYQVLQPAAMERLRTLANEKPNGVIVPLRTLRKNPRFYTRKSPLSRRYRRDPEH